jgi:REP element-mobilizing transposase RayT
MMARGNRKATIFEDADDRDRFVEILADASERYNIVVNAECRMGNHYHAVVRTPDANLSAFAGFLNGAFAQYSNRRHGRTGHLFGDRFKPVLVDTDLYLRVVVSYVEMNPVAAGLVTSPTDWLWSSCRATLGLDPPPPYLCLNWIDSAFPAASRQESQRKYRAYLEGPTLEEAASWLEQPAIGATSFTKDVREHIGETLYQSRVPRSYRALYRPPLEALVPRGLSRKARGQRILRAHVVHAYRISEIACSLDVHPNTVSRIVCGLRRQLRQI